MSPHRTHQTLGILLVLFLLVPVAAPASAQDQVAAALDACRTNANDADLNGDGYDDAVVGDPYATVNGKAEAGAIAVLFGDADGRVGEGARRVLTQASIAGSNVEAGDHFGWSVALDDATGSGCADILVGSPGEDWNGRADAGIAQLIHFTPAASGPGTASSLGLLTQDALGGAVETGDEFGYAVALGNVDDAENPFAMIGAPGEDLDDVDDAGVVSVTGYVENGEFRQGTRGVPGIPQAGDRFGSTVLLTQLHPALTGPDADVEGTDWVLVAGAPGDVVANVGSATGVDNAGSVSFWERVNGFSQQVTQNSPGIPDVAEAGDQFGSSIAVSQSRPLQTNSVRLDIAVGAPGEDVGAVADAGSVTLLESEQTGIRGRLALNQGSAGFAGTVERGDRFGHSVALRPQGRGSEAVLVVGAPYEDIGSTVDAGLVQTVVLADADADVRALRSYTENSPGTPGRVATGSRFGRTVAAVAGTRESLIAMSSPYQGTGSVFLVNTAGVTRSWTPGRGGIPALPSGRFGWSLSGLEIG